MAYPMPPDPSMMMGGMPPMDPSMMAGMMPPPPMGDMSGAGMEQPAPEPQIPEELLGVGPPPQVSRTLLWMPVDPDVQVDGSLCEQIGGRAVTTADGTAACAVAPEGENAPLPPGVTPLEDSYSIRGDSSESAPPVPPPEMGGMMPPPPMPPIPPGY